MQTELNPKRIEKNLIFLQSRDGMLDMFFGLMMMAAALNDTFTFYEWPVPWYVRFLILILMVPFVMGKLFITKPRLGYLRMKPVTGGRKQVLKLFTIIAATLTLLLFAATILKVNGFNDQPVAFHPILEFIFLVSLFGFVGWLMGLHLLFAVGIIMGFAWPIANMIGLAKIAGLPAGIFTLGLPGLVIAIIGVFELVKFLRDHPRKNLQVDYEPGNRS